MAGLLLVILGATGMGTAVKFIPRPVVIGFTNGIAVLIASTQIKDFFGLHMDRVPGEFWLRMKAIAADFPSWSPKATILPVEAAIAYDAAGADELCFLDITASHENRGIILDVVRRTAEACFMPLTVGGGVRSIEDIRALLSSGADKVSINTAAVNRRAFVKEAAEKFGDQCIVVAIDAKQVSKPGEPARWEIFTHGGRNPTGIDAVGYAKEVVALGAGEILLTSMDRDGTRKGYDIPLTRAIADAITVPVIASGGVGALEHLVEGIRDGHATAVLAASIFHFGEHSVREAKQYMAKAGLPMRLDP